MQQYGLIGRRLSHSFSQRYFSRKFEREGISARYDLFEIESIGQFVTLKQHYPRLRGLNVTIPYKSEIIPYLDDLTPVARAIGAVNTVAFRNGRLLGHNTDAVGFETSLQRWLGAFMPSAALILGSGGASRAVKWVLNQRLNIPTTLASRQPTGPDQIGYDDLSREGLGQFPLIVNTTPVGMHPEVDALPPIPVEELGTKHWVYDLIYNPPQTQLLREAHQRGARTINGLRMLILQAQAAWEFWQK